MTAISFLSTERNTASLVVSLLSINSLEKRWYCEWNSISQEGSSVWKQAIASHVKWVPRPQGTWRQGKGHYQPCSIILVFIILFCLTKEWNICFKIIKEKLTFWITCRITHYEKVELENKNISYFILFEKYPVVKTSEHLGVS